MDIVIRVYILDPYVKKLKRHCRQINKILNKFCSEIQTKWLSEIDVKTVVQLQQPLVQPILKLAEYQKLILLKYPTANLKWLY